MQQKLPPTPNIKNDTIFSAIVVVIFFGVLGLWAGLAPLETAAIAPGKIIVSGYQKTIQHLEGGIVSKIQVKDGDRVKSGQVLIVLQKTLAQSRLTQTQNKLIESQAAVLRIQAELKGAKELKFESDSRFINYPDIMKLQQSIFETNNHVFLNTLNIQLQQIKQLEQQIVGIEAKVKANQQQDALINKELKDIRALVEKHLVKQSRLFALEREAAQLSGARADYKAQIAQLQQKIGEVKIEVVKLKNDHNQQLLEQLKQEQQKIKELHEQGIAETDVLDRTIIRSPIAGTVVGLQIHTAGAVIKPGEVLMHIVPVNEMLVMEVRINPLDIDVVHPGLAATVRITSFSRRTAPVLTGKVTNVSADALVDETTGKTYYLAEICIPKQELEKLLPQEKLYPGMPVEAMIVTNTLTPWEYFVAPVQRSFNRAFREQ